jgi:hypothetical protein
MNDTNMQFPLQQDILLKDLKVGDRIREYDMGLTADGTVLSAPRFSGGTWTCDIEVDIMNDVELKVPSIVRYAMTDGFEHYGPKLSLLSRQS